MVTQTLQRKEAPYWCLLCLIEFNSNGAERELSSLKNLRLASSQGQDSLNKLLKVTATPKVVKAEHLITYCMLSPLTRAGPNGMQCCPERLSERNLDSQQFLQVSSFCHFPCRIGQVRFQMPDTTQSNFAKV